MGVKKYAILISLLAACTVFAQWDKYPTYQQYLDIMAKFQADYPLLCKVEEFGTSVNNRKLLAAKISDNVAVDEAEPAVLFLSSIHGDELGGYVTSLHLIDSLLSSYGKDSLITKLVDNIEIWINPLANSDGTYSSSDNSVTGARRYNANGVDLNRNFPDTNGTNPSIMQKETDAIIKLCDAHKFIMSIDFHAGMEGVSYPGYGDWEPHTPDELWFAFIQKMWHDLTGWPLPPDFPYTPGARISYAYFCQQSRAVVAEVSVTKLLAESNLMNLWDKLKSALFLHIEQSLYGIKGIITDSATGEPVKAKVFVENHDKDSSWVFSHLPHGDYYRPMIEGIYAVTFSAPGYISRTVTGVTVKNNKATIVDVKLAKEMTGIHVDNCIKPGLNINVRSGSVRFIFNAAKNGEVRISLFDISGRLIRELIPEAVTGSQSIVWNGTDKNGLLVSNGCYVAHIQYGGKVFAQRFLFSR